MFIENVFIINIPFEEALQDARDIKHIFDALGKEYVSRLTWGIKNLWWLGEEDLDPLEPDSETESIIISGGELLEVVQLVTQTLDGTLAGYLSKEDATEVLSRDWSRFNFKISSACVVIHVVEDVGFDIYLKDKSSAEKLVQSFPDATWEDPVHFFF